MPKIRSKVLGDGNTYWYCIQNQKVRSAKWQREIMKGIYYQPIYVGVANTLNDADRAMKMFTDTGAPVAITMFPSWNAEEVVRRMIEQVGTVYDGGTLMNVPPNFKPTTGDSRGKRYIYETPLGSYKGRTAAAQALTDFNKKLVSPTALRMWCMYPDMIIKHKLRHKFPIMFNKKLTFREAGFGRRES